MKSFFGIPAHPLFVHIPAVLLPLAAVGVVVMLIRPAWHRRYRWAVLAIGFIGTVGAILAVEAGEQLAEQLEGNGQSEGRWESHAEAGENARLFAIIFFVVLLAFVLVPWFVERRAAQDRPIAMPKWIGAVLAVLVFAASVGTVYTVIDAGHSGAKAVWCETVTPPNCDSGG